MTKAGQNNISGVEAQIWAAMSLFLQYVQDTKFDHIVFEGLGLEDFHLVFTDGHKIICESKKSAVGYAQAREILEKVANHRKITDRDSILIISTKINASLRGEIENYKYFKDIVKKSLKGKKHKFEDKHLYLIPQLRFWEVPQQRNEEIVSLLISRLLKVWVPKRRIEEIKDSVTLQKAFHGSAVGRTLSRLEFMDYLEKKKVEILEDARYEKEKEKAEESIKELHELISGGLKDKLKVPDTSILTNDSTKFHFVVSELRKQQNKLNLPNGDSLWKATRDSFMASVLFDIFKDNLHTQENIEYSLDFCQNTLKDGYNSFRDEFIKVDIAKLCDAISEKSQQFDEEVFKILTDLFKPSLITFFYSERRFQRDDDTWEREEMSSRLYKIYERSTDQNFRKKAIDYVVENFNIVQDDDKHWHYSPPSVFQILREYVKENPQERIFWLKDVCVRQYDNYISKFRSKLKFDGWEFMGSGIAQSGSDFSISDLYFVSRIIMPSIAQIEAEERWYFVSQKCISRTIEDVSYEKPDFLNRASIPTLFDEYKNGKHSKEAFEILSDFIKMRKGIPWKADLIYQNVRNDNGLTDKQKWNLVKVSLDEFGNLPVNVFVQQIVSTLASESQDRNIQLNAIEVIKSWSENPEYEKRTVTESFDIVDNVNRLLDKPETLNDGINIFRTYVTSAPFIKNDDSWRIWDVTKALANILTRDFERGIEILETVNSSSKLTFNQQNLISSSLYNIPDEQKELIGQIYKRFLRPLLESLDNSIDKIVVRFDHRYARELFVQFAEKLAKTGYYTEAFSIIKIFINDPDPILGRYDDEESDDFNEHEKVKRGEDTFSIRTVRGYCAWGLQKLVVPRNFKRIDETRAIIEESLPLIEKLATDPNYYVRIQAAVPLLELAKNRNTVLPENRKERFLSVETAEKIKEVAFLMLRDPENHTLPAVMKQIVRVFSYMRSLTQEEAMEVLESFLVDNYPDKKKVKGYESYLADVMGEAAPLYIFYALFRKFSFKDWPRGWQELGKFDDEPFIELLNKVVTHEDMGIRNTFAWQFARLPDEITKTPEDKRIISLRDSIKISANYLSKMTQTYDHNVFDDIYRFVKEYIDEEFELCFKLWCACIIVEHRYFKDNFSAERLVEMSWWPYFYNGEILIKIAEKVGEEKFLIWLEKLLDYPVEVTIANDLDIVVERLEKVKGYDSRVEKIFINLMQRSPKYYENKQRWKMGG